MKLPHLFIFALLAGCSVAPDYEAPVMPTPPWRNVQDVTLDKPSVEWWRQFGNEELNALLAQAMAANNDVQASIHRVAQARAAARITASSLLPFVDASANAGRDYTNPARGRSDTSSSFRAGLQAGYEVDLFGRNRSNVYAALSDVQAADYTRESLALVVMSDTAQSYISLLAANDRLAIAQENLINAHDIMRLTQARFDAGTLSGIELAQQKVTLASAEASFASLEQQREALSNQLAVLVGRPPQDFAIAGNSLSAVSMPQLASVQPAELLVHRPDIRAAEAQLQAANYDIGAARAAFFPNFSLSASSVISASPISAPTALATALAASVTQPIFQGGALTAGLELAKARRAELEEQYKKIVLTSFQEVQDALAAEHSAHERVLRFTDAEAQAQKTYALVRQRFDTGTIDFLTLLDAQRSLYSSRTSLIDARAEHYNAAISLYKALGGGWNRMPPA